MNQTVRKGTFSGRDRKGSRCLQCNMAFKCASGESKQWKLVGFTRFFIIFGPLDQGLDAVRTG